MIRIALDAMGSDNAPQVEVEGAAQALKELPPEFQVQLVGRTGDIEAALARLPTVDRSRIAVVDRRPSARRDARSAVSNGGVPCFVRPSLSRRSLA